MKNKAFYYKKDVVRRSKMYGFTVYNISVYGIKSGRLYKVGECTQNSGATCGDIGECWRVMQRAGIAPQRVDVFGSMYSYLRENNILIQDIENLYCGRS